MEILYMKNTITDIKNSMDKTKNRLYINEDKINELEAKLE